jgi:hypothetical protein
MSDAQESKALPRATIAQDDIPRSIPDIYFNGFEIRLGTGDIFIILKRRNEEVGVIEMSFTVAKTLSLGLAQTVTALEETTGKEIMTTRFVESKITELTFPKEEL